MATIIKSTRSALMRGDVTARIFLAVLAGYAITLVTTQAHAAFKVCNHSPSKIHVAIAYGPKDAPGTSTGGHLGVTAKGWWGIEPQECAQLSSIHAGNHWVYYQAKSNNGTTEGSSLLCISDKSFTIPQQFKRRGEACKANQYLAGFKRLETSKANHTLNIR